MTDIFDVSDTLSMSVGMSVIMDFWIQFTGDFRNFGYICGNTVWPFGFLRQGFSRGLGIYSRARPAAQFSVSARREKTQSRERDAIFRGILHDDFLISSEHFQFSVEKHLNPPVGNNAL